MYARLHPNFSLHEFVFITSMLRKMLIEVLSELPEWIFYLGRRKVLHFYKYLFKENELSCSSSWTFSCEQQSLIKFLGSCNLHEKCSFRLVILFYNSVHSESFKADAEIYRPIVGKLNRLVHRWWSLKLWRLSLLTLDKREKNSWSILRFMTFARVNGLLNSRTKSFLPDSVLLLSKRTVTG